MNYLSYADAIEHCIDYLGGNPVSDAVRDAKRSIVSAYRELTSCHNWTYYYKHGRINCVAPYSTGTIQYTHTGGTHERLVTLTGGTWPSWSNEAYIRVGMVNWKVDELIDSTNLTLDPIVNPGQDIASGTAYNIYKDAYDLPEDWGASDQALYEQTFGGMTYVHPREWLYENRYIFAIGVPQFYTFAPSNRQPMRYSLRVMPFPTESKTIDFMYRRIPRPLRIDSYYQGTASVSLDGTTVTAPTASFGPQHEGGLIRLGYDATNAPTSQFNKYPAAFESVIANVLSATTVQVFDPSPVALSGVAWRYSDLVDIETGTLMTAFLRGCEKQIGMSRILKDKPSAARQYQDALDLAKCADSRSLAGRSEGSSLKFRQRLRDMPRGPDQP